MSRLPMLDYKTVERLLIHLGFIQTRQRGSHVFFRHPDGRTTNVPNHKGRDISHPLLREILREIELDIDGLENALKQL